MLDVSVGLDVWGPLGVEVSATDTYSAVGLDPQDLQVSLGIAAVARPRGKSK